MCLSAAIVVGVMHVVGGGAPAANHVLLLNTLRSRCHARRHVWKGNAATCCWNTKSGCHLVGTAREKRQRFIHTVWLRGQWQWAGLQKLLCDHGFEVPGMSNDS